MKTGFILLFLVISFSCNQSGSKNNIVCIDTVNDSYNRKVTFTDNPHRIISAAPGITEIIFALGEQKRLIGRTEYCDFPPQVTSIPPVGGLEDPNIEIIVTMSPDLVIASTHFKKEMVDKLEKVKIPIIVFTSDASFEGTYKLIQNIGDILNVGVKADSIVRKMKKDVERTIIKVNSTTDRPKVYYVIGYGKTGDFTAGGDTFINQLIEMAGGNNIAKDLTGWSYSLEKLFEHDPDIIIIRKGDKESFLKSTAYTNLKAVKTGKVFEIDNNLIERVGPRLAEGLQALYDIIHNN